MSRAALLALVFLGGCNLAPIYAGGSSGPAATLLSGVEVSPIPDRAGWEVRSALRSRLGAEDAPKRYRLDIRLDDRIEGFGIRGDNSIARERRTLRARWQLVDLASSKVLLDATAGSDAGVDVVSSEYAVVAAETTALDRLAARVADQIAARVAVYARAQGATAAR